jgi:hypothetical protein
MDRKAIGFGALALLGMFVSGCGGSNSAFSVLTTIPAISGVTPNPVTRGSTLTINGTGFNGTLTTAQFVSSGGVTTTSVASSGNSTSVTVVVPTSIAVGTYSLDVIDSDGQGDNSSPSNTVSVQLQ